MRALLFALCLIVLTGCKQSKEEEKQQETTPKVVTTYYLIRHAEKDRSDPENKDPELTAQGQRRASFWADHFKAVDLDAVYSSDYARTRQTAMPTAGLNGLEIEIYDPGNLYGEAFFLLPNSLFKSSRTVRMEERTSSSSEMPVAIVDES